MTNVYFHALCDQVQLLNGRGTTFSQSKALTKLTRIAQFSTEEKLMRAIDALADALEEFIAKEDHAWTLASTAERIQEEATESAEQEATHAVEAIANSSRVDHFDFHPIPSPMRFNFICLVFV